MNRHETHSFLSAALAQISDHELQALLEQARPLHKGIDGQSYEFQFQKHRIFVKKLPLSSLEVQAKDSHKTCNLFSLPLFCHYGLGSPGFSSWRELAANQMATRWVLANECSQFSLLYHWRVLPASNTNSLTEQNSVELERQIQFWGNSAEIRHRFQSLSSPSAELFLFLEYIPQTLISWIKGQASQGADSLHRALIFAEKNMNETITFMKNRGLVHFDTHFENIMTDGERLYFNDFGLALSSEFNLSPEEKDFLERHQNYDYLRAADGLMHALVTSVSGADYWRENLKILTNSNSLPTELDTLIKKYGLLSLAMMEFSQKLKNESRHTPFPDQSFTKALHEVHSEHILSKKN